MAKQRLTSRQIIERFVSIPTVSQDSNLELIDWTAAYLRSHGIEARLTYNEARDKANLFATIGPAVPGGVVLSGHTDVVPVEGQAWTTEPFKAVERDGRLYGRGTADMKSFLAVAVALAPELKARPLLRPVHLALSFDEEVGCTGVGGLIHDMLDNVPRPGIVIVGEPTEMHIVNAHKSAYRYETVICGRPAHSSQPHRGTSAIMAAGRIIAFLDEISEQRRLGMHQAPGFEPPYTTFQVGLIGGGVAINIIAQECRFLWEFRSVPGEDPAAIERQVREFIEHQVLPRMREVAPEASIEIRPLSVVPPLQPEEDGPAERLVRRLTGANATSVVSYATEAGLFQRAGISTVICGPGSIDQAHQPDEFIALDQIAACEVFLRRVADWAAAPA